MRDSQDQPLRLNPTLARANSSRADPLAFESARGRHLGTLGDREMSLHPIRVERQVSPPAASLAGGGGAQVDPLACWS